MGTAVRQLKPGDRVAIDPAVSCHACDQCLAGRPHTCRRLRFLGCPGQLDGCLSDLIVLPQECCYRIADKTTMEQAALAEPLSIGLYSVRQAGPLEKARIAILGAGPIGLSVLLAARCHGVQRVYMTDKIDARLAVPRRAGADWTGNPNSTEIVAAVAAHEPLHLDVVFECCGDQAALDQAVGLLKPGGKLMLVGIPAVARVSFAAEQLRRNELILHNVRRQNACVRPALDLIEHDRVDVDHLITHRFPFEQTQDAFDLVAGYRDGVVKAVVHCAP